MKTNELTIEAAAMDPEVQRKGRLVLEHVIAHPEQHEQSVVLTTHPDAKTPWDCGTHGCMIGWTSLLLASELNLQTVLHDGIRAAMQNLYLNHKIELGTWGDNEENSCSESISGALMFGPNADYGLRLVWYGIFVQKNEEDAVRAFAQLTGVDPESIEGWEKYLEVVGE